MTASRLTGLFLCSTAIGAVKPTYAPDGAGGFGNREKKKTRRSNEFTILEPRMLFDGAGAEILDEVDFAADVIGESNQATDHDALLAALESPVLIASKNIVFIDSAVNDTNVMMAQIAPDAEVYILNSDCDGVEQIAAVLQNRTDIESLSIISHGRSGTLDLGSTQLTEASMAGRYSDEMIIIRQALCADADIMIYGCEFGAGAKGQAAMQTLANLTGANVASSDDLTGAAELGGDRILGQRNSEIETSSTIQFCL